MDIPSLVTAGGTPPPWKIQGACKLLYQAGSAYLLLADVSLGQNKLGRALRYGKYSVLCSSESNLPYIASASEEFLHRSQISRNLYVLRSLYFRNCEDLSTFPVLTFQVQALSSCVELKLYRLVNLSCVTPGKCVGTSIVSALSSQIHSWPTWRTSSWRILRTLVSLMWLSVCTNIVEVRTYTSIRLEIKIHNVMMFLKATCTSMH